MMQTAPVPTGLGIDVCSDQHAWVPAKDENRQLIHHDKEGQVFEGILGRSDDRNDIENSHNDFYLLQNREHWNIGQLVDR